MIFCWMWVILGGKAGQKQTKGTHYLDKKWIQVGHKVDETLAKITKVEKCGQKAVENCKSGQN